ncbi:MAG: gliding motility-associated ABC transporter substrate-binding protein GldG [Bacteroidota bacterium]
MSVDNYKLGIWLKLALGVLLIMLMNQLASRYRIRLDMTEEQRYTITDATKEVLSQAQDALYIEVYLDGELPSNFIRFQTAIRETLEEFSVYTPVDLEYRFIDPSQAESQRARNQYYQGLMEQGLQPSNLNVKKDGGQTQIMVFPGLIISSGGQDVAVNLLKGSRASSIEEVLNQSIEGLEYEIANGIALVSGNSRKRVGLVYGHNEPDSADIAGFTNLVLSKYDLFRINLPNRTTPLSGYDLIVITKPAIPFTENEKYLLDQYVMKGGRLLFFLDALGVDMDLVSGEGTIAVPYENNLTDLLFKYGVRINNTYVADINCGNTPIVAGNMGDNPQISMLPWPYFPIITNYGDHPVVKNMDALQVRFASEIDTVKAEGIKKTPLFFTSAHSKVLGAPVRVSYNDLKDELLPEKFTHAPVPLAYLLEGKFQSLYKNRFIPAGFDKTDFRPDGLESKMAVIADGDLIRNDFDLETGNPLTLGVDPYTREHYANETLIMNLMEYLMDDSGLIQARAKEIQIRPLDKAKIKEERTKWQLINIVGPLVLLILFGLVKMYLRKVRYSK